MKTQHPKITLCLRILACILVLILLAGIITGFVIAQKREAPGEFVYLIVLGTTVNGTEPSVMLQDRINAAYDYLTAHPNVQCIVSGGKGDNENLTEAACMYNALTAMGIEADRVWTEDKATSTIENLQFSMDLIQEKTGSRPICVGLLSSDFHMYRAQMFAREAGIAAVSIYAPSTHDANFYKFFLREILLVWYYSIF